MTFYIFTNKFYLLNMKNMKNTKRVLISFLLFALFAYYGNANDTGIPAKKYYSATVDNKNNIWFLTEMGIVSFNGQKWTLHNGSMQGKDLKDIAFDISLEGTGFWIATGSGVSSLKSPFEGDSPASSYTTDNATILSNSVLKVVVGKNNVKWIGTLKGVAAYSGSKWLDISYDDLYPSVIFEEYPITSMATNPAGDSLYVGTKGAGIARVFRNEVDGISGASVYAQWGPIILPSDNVFSVYIEKNGMKWFGTDMGVASHNGSNTLENWVVYTKEEGLVNDYVQAIGADLNGCLWFGTQGGISVFDGKLFTNYTTDNGLNSNNILCIVTDSKGVVWIGTDNGVNSFTNGTFVSYK